MKKALMTLVLLLLYNTSFAQTPDKIEQQLESIKQSVSEIRGYFQAVEDRVEVNRRGEKIHITFPPSEEVDVQFRRLTDNKGHSVQWLLRNWTAAPSEINPESGEYTFEPNPSPDWEITVGAGKWDQSGFVFDWAESYIVEKYNPVSESQSCKWWGYWDSRYTPKDAPANLFRCYLNNNCNEGIERGNRLAILLNDFRPNDSDTLIRKRLQNWDNHMTDEVREATEFIILEDEPRHKGFSVEQLESMVEIAKEEMGDFKFTFSFMRRTNWENILPENLDVVWINFYPFYRQDYYPEMFNASQEEFNDVLSSTVMNVRKKIPNAKIMLTGQAFYDDHYREPPLESVQWYHEFIQKHDYILGVLWYQWRDNKGTGTKSMPELYNVQRREFEQSCQD